MEKKPKPLKCHNCNKPIPSRLLIFSNVCSEKCAKQLSQKIEEKFKEEELNQKKKLRADWEKSPYYPLVKEYEEKVIAEHDKNSTNIKNKIPQQNKNKTKTKLESNPKKVKCLGCSKMLELSGFSNVCNLKCAEKYSKNYNYQLSMANLDEKQKKKWQKVNYPPLVKELKNKIPTQNKKKLDYSVFKKPNLNDLDELMEENYKDNDKELFVKDAVAPFIDDFKQIMEGFKEKFNELKKEKQKNHEEITLLDILNTYKLKSESNLKINSIKDCCKVSECCKIPKGWGHELIIHNCKEYCGKILVFKEGCKFSMHYHILKQETWYIQKGDFKFYYIDTKKGILHKRTLTKGDVVTIERGMPHQLEAITDGKVFEISTEHFDSDSYRIAKGD